MRLRFTIYPASDVESYHCELQVTEQDLQLDPEVFAVRFLCPAAAALLNAFEEPWPDTPQKVLAMLNRGGPRRGVEFYRTRFQKFQKASETGHASTPATR